MEDDELLNHLLDDLVGDAEVRTEMNYNAKCKRHRKVVRTFYAECAEQSAKDITRTRAMIVDLFHRRTSHE